MSGTPVALGADGDYAVIGTSTQRLVAPSSNGNAAPVIHVAGTSYTQQVGLFQSGFSIPRVFVNAENVSLLNVDPTMQMLTLKSNIA